MFQKKLQVATKPLYTLGHAKTFLIVGLGNPGKKYEATRHSLGFLCVDYFAKVHEFPGWSNKKDLKAQLNMLTLNDNKRVILLKPATFMNNSGEAVRAVQQFYEISTKDILVIHDELDLEFGQIRTKMGGGSAGHNGLKSLLEHISEDFGRVRIGIGKPSHEMSGAKYVLAKFNTNENKDLERLKREVAAILDEYIQLGVLKAETRSFKL